MSCGQLYSHLYPTLGVRIGNVVLRVDEIEEEAPERVMRSPVCRTVGVLGRAVNGGRAEST